MYSKTTGPVQRMTYIDNYFEIKWE